MKGRSYASKTYNPGAVAEVKCSTGDVEKTYPQVDCNQQSNDATAAYTQALMWYFTDDETYAKNAIKIINAWANTNTKIWFDQPRIIDGQLVYGNPGDGKGYTQGYAGGLLRTAWATENMIRGAEIIRHTYKTPTTGGWTTAEINKAETYFKTVVMDVLGAGWTKTTNWETSVAEAWTNIGVFTNDKAIYDKGINYWRQEVPRYIYMSSDGATPLSPFKSVTWLTGSNGLKYMVTAPKNVDAATLKGGWYNANSYINGLSLETCRDIGHTMMGFGAMANTAETARIQGVDLYGEQKDRIIAGYELHAKYINEIADRMVAAGKPLTGNSVGTDINALASSSGLPKNSPWVCSGFTGGGGSAFLGLELAYNQYANRKGIAMPNTKKITERVRNQIGGNHMFWETLSHANNPN